MPTFIEFEDFVQNNYNHKIDNPNLILILLSIFRKFISQIREALDG